MATPVASTIVTSGELVHSLVRYREHNLCWKEVITLVMGGTGKAPDDLVVRKHEQNSTHTARTQHTARTARTHSTQHAHSTQHTAHSTQHTAHSTQHTAHSTQHTAHSTHARKQCLIKPGMTCVTTLNTNTTAVVLKTRKTRL